MNDGPMSEMAQLTLVFEDIDDFDMLCDAARIAWRSPEQFVLEEVLYLAGMIAATGGTKNVMLARHHRGRDAEFFAAFRKGAMQSTANAPCAAGL